MQEQQRWARTAGEQFDLDIADPYAGLASALGSSHLAYPNPMDLLMNIFNWALDVKCQIW